MWLDFSQWHERVMETAAFGKIDYRACDLGLST